MDADMSYPVDWNGANKILGPPKGYEEDQVCKMAIFTNGVVCVSKWQLSPEALKYAIETGCLFISIISGQTQPPIFIGNEEECKAIAVDYGKVWK